MGEEEILRKKLFARARKQVQEKLSERDLNAIKAVNLIEDLDSVFNLLTEQVIEWNNLYFPELKNLLKENTSILKVISFGEKTKIKKLNLEKAIGEQKAEQVLDALKNSIGADLKQKDVLQIQGLAFLALEVKDRREELVSYLDKEMNQILPNFSELSGAFLGAKLLSQAGSIKKLVLLPSSTIQLLGAEKALFQHLKTGSNPPKYGFIFAHPLIKSQKSWNKGKMSRALASKLCIALKTDFYGKQKIAEKLKKDLEKRAKQLESIPFKQKPKKPELTKPKKKNRKKFKKKRKH